MVEASTLRCDVLVYSEEAVKLGDDGLEVLSVS